MNRLNHILYVALLLVSYFPLYSARLVYNNRIRQTIIEGDKVVFYTAYKNRIWFNNQLNISQSRECLIFLCLQARHAREHFNNNYNATIRVYTKRHKLVKKMGQDLAKLELRFFAKLHRKYGLTYADIRDKRREYE